MATSPEFPAPFRLRPFGSSETDHICLDLLLLILPCLPVQALLLCRSVCKSWKQIVDSTSFIADHLAHQTPRILLQNSFYFLLLNPQNPPILDTLQSPNDIDFSRSQPSELRAVSTIHGVVCLYDNANSLFLWNPSIRRRRRIPLPPLQSSACRNIEWYKYCGFWMDSCAREFKIVIFYIGAYDRGGCLFSSVDKNWREIPQDEMADYSQGDYGTCHPCPQVMMDGVAYWIAVNMHEYYGGLVVSYDFEKGRFGKISLPDVVSSWGLIIYLSKWRGSLSVVVTQGYPIQITEFELWELKNGSWSKMMAFSPGQLERVFCVLDCGLALAATKGKRLVLYDDEDAEYGGSCISLCSKKHQHVPVHLYSRFSVAYDFVESFVFPDEI